MSDNPDEVIAPDSQEEIPVAEVMRQIRADIRRRQAELKALGDRALPVEDGQWEQRVRELRAKAHVRERPFVSHAPLIGRFIAFFREKWNSIAAKWYVRPMLHQQNIFNQAVVQTIQEMLEAQTDLDRYLELVEERIVSSDRDATLLARKIAEGEYRLRKWEERASRERIELAHNLSRLEEMLSQGEGEQKAG